MAGSRILPKILRRKKALSNTEGVFELQAEVYQPTPNNNAAAMKVMMRKILVLRIGILLVTNVTLAF